MITAMTWGDGGGLDRLKRVTMALSALSLIGMSTPGAGAFPVTSFGTHTLDSYTSSLAVAPLGLWQGVSSSITSPMLIEEVTRRCLKELKVALRILREFRDDLMPELVAYVAEVDAVLSPIGETISAAQCQPLADRLWLARTRFSSEAQAVKTWLRLSDAIDHTHVGPRRVPERFVVAYEPEPELFWSESDAHVDRALRELFEGDADPAAS